MRDFFFSCCATLDRLIYCIGGCYEQNVLDECERYNAELDEWTSIMPLQTARFQVTFFFIALDLFNMLRVFI